MIVLYCLFAFFVLGYFGNWLQVRAAEWDEKYSAKINCFLYGIKLEDKEDDK